jgi:hypothetical protein
VPKLHKRLKKENTQQVEAAQKNAAPWLLNLKGLAAIFILRGDFADNLHTIIRLC